MPTTKTCTKCGETKPLDGFDKRRDRKCGVRAACKPCMAEYHRRYREANRDKIAENHRRYREKNPEKVAESARRWRKANPNYDHRRYETHRGEIREQRRRYHEENREILGAKVSKYIREAQELSGAFATVSPGTPWTSEEEQFLMADNGMTVYQKATALGRTYSSCTGKLYSLRKKLGVSPGDH